MTTINNDLTLPSGLKLKNRLCKAAMTENLADPESRATEQHYQLYKSWAQGGTGLLITGNVQVDRRFMEGPGNVAIEGEIQNEKQLARLERWKSSVEGTGAKIFVQLGHAGRQSNTMVNTDLIGPSAKKMNDPDPLAPKITIREITVEEIQDVKTRFIGAAKVCKQSGFDGIQIHSAHGYLLSSFLNPRANQRTDEFGGSLENRARLLLDIVKDLQDLRDESFAISVKINSADFQKGGFTVEECAQVVEWLDKAGIDLIEISGGNYESPVVFTGKTGSNKKANKSTERREAYFLEFAKGIRQNITKSVLMVTGGFRSLETMNNALEQEETQLIGIGRPLCLDPSASQKLLDGEIKVLPQIEKQPLPFYLKPLYFTTLGPKIEFYAHTCHCYQCIFAISEDKPLPAFRALPDVFHFRRHQSKTAAALVGIDCKGSIYNNN